MHAPHLIKIFPSMKKILGSESFTRWFGQESSRVLGHESIVLASLLSLSAKSSNEFDYSS